MKPMTTEELAEVLITSMRIHEESYQPAHKTKAGRYKIDEYKAAKIAAEQMGLDPRLSDFIPLANHWSNDIQMWAEGILGKEKVGKLMERR